MSNFDDMFGDYQPPTALEKAAGAFRRLGHTLSMIPFISVVAGLPAGVAALLSTVDGFMNKGFGVGAKAAVSGTVDTAITGMTGALESFGARMWWMPMNWAAKLATGSTLGELSRTGSNAVLDSFIPDSFSGTKSPTQLAREAQVLGANPMMTASVPAAIGYAQLPQMQMAMQQPVNPATLAPLQPNQWRQMEAQRRGMSLEQADSAFIRNNREEALMLQRAAAPQQQLGAS